MFISYTAIALICSSSGSAEGNLSLKFIIIVDVSDGDREFVVTFACTGPCYICVF